MKRICKRGHEAEVGKRCKECKKIYRLNNPEKIKAISKKYYINNPEKIKAISKKYYINNSEKIKARKKEYLLNNSEKIKAIRKKYYINNPEIKARNKKYKLENPEKIKNTELVRTYGITLEMYNKMLVDQNFCCAICGKHNSNFKKQLSVDHDHETGAVRGLLCHHCNTGIGMFKDNTEILKKATNYLEKNGKH